MAKAIAVKAVPPSADTSDRFGLHDSLLQITDEFVIHQLERCLMDFGHDAKRTIDHAEAALRLKREIHAALWRFHCYADKQ